MKKEQTENTDILSLDNLVEVTNLAVEDHEWRITKEKRPKKKNDLRNALRLWKSFQHYLKLHKAIGS